MSKSFGNYFTIRQITARAKEFSEDPINLSRRYCEEFHHDMAYLNCLPPSVEPCVSDHIPQIIDMIRQILDNGFASTIGRDVYFFIEKFSEYAYYLGLNCKITGLVNELLWTLGRETRPTLLCRKGIICLFCKKRRRETLFGRVHGVREGLDGVLSAVL